jgi:hypothetical protein
MHHGATRNSNTKYSSRDKDYSPAKLHKKQHSFKKEQQFMYSSDGAKEGAEDRHWQIEKRMNSVALDNLLYQYPSSENVSELENGSSNDKNFCIGVLWKVENALGWIGKLTQLYDTFAQNKVVVAHISDNIIS